jgi:hypothetical protein
MPKAGFFKRRKILLATNGLDLVPIALVQHEINEDGKLKLIIPRFQNKLLESIFTGKKKGKFYRISLDNIGAEVWKLIDGHRTIGEISEILAKTNHENNIPFEEGEKRVVAFVTRLYQERYLSFRQFETI